MTTFYTLRTEYKKKSAISIQSIIKYDTLSIIDENSPLLINNKFKIAQGKKQFDTLQFDDSICNFAISSKLKKILEDNNIKGWQCFPIIIEGVEDAYFAFQIIGKAGPILNLEALYNYETENREFDISTWDGSDIFNLQDSLATVITLKVKELLENNKITNIEIRPL